MASTISIFPQPTPSTIRVLKTVGITASAFLFGQTAATTLELAPILLDAPAPVLARQWAKAYRILHQTRGPLLGGCIAIFAFLASYEPVESIPRKLYTTAAILLPSQIVYSIFYMVPTNDALHAKAKEYGTSSGAIEENESMPRGEMVHALVRRWGFRMVGNALFCGMAAVCATCAVIV